MAVEATTDRPPLPLPLPTGLLRLLLAGLALVALTLVPSAALAQSGGDTVGGSSTAASGAGVADTAGFVACRRSEPGCAGKRLVANTLLEGERVKVDGVLDDSVWSRVEFTSDFMMKEPEEGGVPTERTEIAFTYDDHAIYIGARMFSDDPSQIRAVKTRRDSDGNSERLIITFDSYYDRLTGYTFAVTAAGVRLDWYHPQDSEFRRDRTFNPVWAAKARIDSLGWTAEMEIPFSQLRFNNAENQVWGVNINRYIPQKNEDLFWVAVPRDESGYQSWFGDMVGISNVQSRRPVEVTPYGTTNAIFTSSELVDQSDPFNSRAEAGAQFGLDVKAGLGSSLTLDVTVNPDFGQVEQDPAVVNLSAFEVFFPERRPFFLEGRQLLEGKGPGYYYSRRIGQPPRGDVPVNVDFQDRPDQTTIIGAAKLTGRTPSGLSVGGLLAFTPHENAVTLDVDDPENQFRDVRIEPPTGYGVLRLEQELGRGSTVGIIGTGTRRHFEQVDPLRSVLRQQAYSGGVDWNLRFANGTYELSGHAGAAYIQGSRSSIDLAQTSSARFYQRPDANCNVPNPVEGCYLDYDPTRTSLFGYSARLEFDKTAAQHWLWGVEGGFESPGFELNDLGRLQTADDIDAFGYVRYRENEPGKLFHRYNLSFYTGSGWNFGGTRQYTFFDLELFAQLKSFWGFNFGGEFNPRSQSDNLTRGGISMGRGYQWNVNGNFFSDFRKKTRIDAFLLYGRGETGGHDVILNGNISFQPGGSWELSLGPRWSRGTNSRQFIQTEARDNPRTFGERYIFAFVDRSTFATRFRLNYSFTPDFSLEGYAEPFVSTGSFYRYGELECWKCQTLREYGTDGTTIEVVDAEAPQELLVTDGDQQFTLTRGDFNFLSFRTNLVARWEWRPGSTIFLVWQLNRADGAAITNPSPANPGNYLDAITAPGQSFFAVKITYWIPF